MIYNDVGAWVGEDQIVELFWAVANKPDEKKAQHYLVRVFDAEGMEIFNVEVDDDESVWPVVQGILQ